jgi:hypothetical protein
MRPGERQVPVGSLLAGGGALVVIASLFLHWYDDLTGFTVFEVLDLVLLGLAIASLLAAAEGAGLQLSDHSLFARGRSLLIGIVTLVIVFSQTINEPPAVVHSGSGPELGLWLALGGSLLMVVGAVLGAARLSLAVDIQRRGRSVTDEPTVASASARPPAGPDDDTLSEPPLREPPV